MDRNTYLKQVRLLNKCSAYYYLYNDSLIPDSAFDQLFLEVQEFEKDNPDKICQDSPTQRVGMTVNKSDLVKREHLSPMGSLDNVFSLNEAESFMKKFLALEKDGAVIVEPKMDGLAVNLIYKKGVFQYALTRGDGTIGEEVTHTIQTIHSIPLELKDKTVEHLEVRGEVFMSLTVFDELNKSLKRAGKNIFSNPRNAAAGTVRQLDATVARERRLSFFPYDVIGHSQVTSQTLAHCWLQEQDFFLSELISKPVESLEEVYEIFKNIQKRRPQLPYEIDGLVVKVNDFRFREQLGSTARAPKWAFAWKFEASTAVTTLYDVEFQVGRLGTITPVAKLEATEIGGVLVSSATLHNEDEIIRKDLRLQDKVCIRRAGDVIPEVIEPLKECRDGTERSIAFPKNCPSCLVELMKDKASYYCPNSTGCPEQQVLQFVHFCSKHALNIEYLSIATIRQLYEKNLLRKKEDLFLLKKEDLLSLEGFGEKSTQRLLDSLEKSKTVSEDKLLYALGVPHIGRVMAKRIVQSFPLEQFKELTAEKLESTDGVGAIVADSLVTFFQSKNNWQTLSTLLETLDIKKNSRVRLALTDGVKNIVITGSFGSVKREQIEDKIHMLGHKVQKQVNKTTHYLVVGDKPGSKYKKAQELNIPIVELTALEDILAPSKA